MKPVPTSAKLSLLLVTLFLMVAGYLISPALTANTRTNRRSQSHRSRRKSSRDNKNRCRPVTIDALVLQKNTSRVVGNLKQENFLVSEDGNKQAITHFSQDNLPLSVLLLIDRGSCLGSVRTGGSQGRERRTITSQAER